MPKGPKRQKHPADVIGNVVKVMLLLAKRQILARLTNINQTLPRHS